MARQSGHHGLGCPGRQSEVSKIAYIGPTGVFGGVRAIQEHLNRLTARGHDCTLITTDGSQLTWLPTQFAQRPASDPGTGYDVVVGTALGTWPLALDLARRLNCKSAGFMQMAEWLFTPQESPEYHATMQAFAAPVDSVMAISEWLAKMAEQVDGRVVHRIRNGVDTALFYRQPFPDLPPFEGLTVVTEGYSANRAKDVQEMTLSVLRRARYDLGMPLRVIGFSQFPQPHELFDRYFQQPPQHIIRMIYSSGDIFLKASRFEGRPGPDVEAMACGTPVCRAIGTGDDDLHDGQNCLKANYGALERYFENFMRLAKDPELRSRLAANGLEYVKTHYHWDGAIDRVEEALTGAVSQPQGEPKQYAYELSEYNTMQQQIVEWETPQAIWLGETLERMLEPRAVLDVGCGPGVYLVPFKPAAKVLGIDGAPLAGQALERGEFASVDLRNDWAAPEHFDLALCIEVAEHLPPARSDYLVQLLTDSADAVFFSAAQPGQGGTLHLNEQPREYWLEKFRARGFDLHKRNAELCKAIADNPHCRRVQWLIGNAMLLERQNDHPTAALHVNADSTS